MSCYFIQEVVKVLKLIWKDTLVQKRTLIFAFFFFIYFMIVFQKMGAAGLTGGVVVLTYAIAFGASAIEDKNKVEIMLNSLPIKRSSIVIAKYLSVFSYTFVILLACYFVSTLTSLVELPIKVVPFSIEGALGGIIAVALFTSINFPIIFKYGYIKSRFVNFALFFIFFFGGTSLTGYLKENQHFLKLMVSLGNLSVEQLTLLLLIPTMVILIISIMISLNFYKKREFS